MLILDFPVHQKEYRITRTLADFGSMTVDIIPMCTETCSEFVLLWQKTHTLHSTFINGRGCFVMPIFYYSLRVFVFYEGI